MANLTHRTSSMLSSILLEAKSLPVAGRLFVTMATSSQWTRRAGILLKSIKKSGLSAGKDDVKAKFFIVEPSRESMRRISAAVETKAIEGLVAKAMPFEQAKEAYELSATRGYGRGKILFVLRQVLP